MYVVLTLTTTCFALLCKIPVTFSPLRKAKPQINFWSHNLGCTFSPKTVRTEKQDN